jgi:hypothetical protein
MGGLMSGARALRLPNEAGQKEKCVEAAKRLVKTLRKCGAIDEASLDELVTQCVIYRMTNAMRKSSVISKADADAVLGKFSEYQKKRTTVGVSRDEQAAYEIAKAATSGTNGRRIPITTMDGKELCGSICRDATDATEDRIGDMSGMDWKFVECDHIGELKIADLENTWTIEIRPLQQKIYKCACGEFETLNECVTSIRRSVNLAKNTKEPTREELLKTIEELRGKLACMEAAGANDGK